MVYNISFKSKVIKSLTKIKEPFYSVIKKQIYDLADNPKN
jgi:mRNA interferase RelE/StbE